MFQTYEAAVKFLYDNLPIFQRIGAAALKNDLSNTIKLCEVLGDPHKKFRSIHIAGTNGKGSTSHMLASILQEAGYKTGLYTSPHLKEFTERIKIDGRELSRDFVINFVKRISPHILSISPSFFEITVAMAFDYFAENKVDIAVIETGLGGRLDSTNVITPILSVITNIGWDHKDILGDTLGKIAFEKAGIIKSHVPVVISETQEGIREIFTETASRLGAQISFADESYKVSAKIIDGMVTLDISWREKIIYHDLSLPLQGFYQRKNIAGVLKSVEVLNDLGLSISQMQTKSGLLNVVINTDLKGRWQILGRNPLVVCDTGHNIDGMTEVVTQIEAQNFDRLFIVLGMVKDKDVTSVLEILPKSAYYFFCQAKIPRALDANTLAAQAKEVMLNGSVVPDINDAIVEAKRMATNDDMIFIGGSTFVVSEIKDL
ncbi:MAG: folylpolyglutamate synthase/dihydrofolate synthase family protein [Chryseolinea sp.]